MMTKLRAFHGDPAVKERYVMRVRGHAMADDLIHGKYWWNGKGCAVGCTIHGSEYARYEAELGIPRILARLEDSIFESLSNDRAKDWPVQFLEAAPVGADLSMVWPQFAVWLLVDPVWGVTRFAKTHLALASIQRVAAAYSEHVAGLGPKTAAAWRVLRDAACSYDAGAAYAAAGAAVAACAYDGAEAYVYAEDADTFAAGAAASAANAAVTWAASIYADPENARPEWRNQQASKLLELMAAAPVHEAQPA